MCVAEARSIAVIQSLRGISDPCHNRDLYSMLLSTLRAQGWVLLSLERVERGASVHRVRNEVSIRRDLDDSTLTRQQRNHHRCVCINCSASRTCLCAGRR